MAETAVGGDTPPAAGEGEAALLERLRHHRADRYPVQHATASFHLGTLRLDAGRLEEAAADLARAREHFPEEMAVERAKATTMLGAAHRAAGRLVDAAACFDEAAACFADAEQPGEHGAALHNRGLVARDAGDPELAAGCFERARERFDAAGAGPQAAAAAREQGAARLTAGDPEGALEVLADAGDLAARGGDLAGQGEVANLTGLAQLALDRPEEAAQVFRESAAVHPRGTRPEAFAMAKANLALAWERTDRPARARLAARQALAAGSVPAAVAGQARGLLDRLGGGPGDVLAALEHEAGRPAGGPDVAEADEWPVVWREEAARWATIDGLERDAETSAWVRGLAERPHRIGDLAEPWLGALLELPPAEMEALAAAAIRATGRLEPDAAQRVRAEVGRAMARFHAPQMLRLRDTFDRLAGELGEPTGWG